jgi:hypothetical protein
VEFLKTDARYSYVKLFEAKSSTSNFAITITPLNTD